MTTILLHSSVIPYCTNLYAMNHIGILIYCIAIVYKLPCLESCHCLTCIFSIIISVVVFFGLFKELCAGFGVVVKFSASIELHEFRAVLYSFVFCMQ